jgi:hypothetical protein
VAGARRLYHAHGIITEGTGLHLFDAINGTRDREINCPLTGK